MRGKHPAEVFIEPQTASSTCSVQKQAQIAQSGGSLSMTLPIRSTGYGPVRMIHRKIHEYFERSRTTTPWRLFCTS